MPRRAETLRPAARSLARALSAFGEAGQRTIRPEPQIAPTTQPNDRGRHLNWASLQLRAADDVGSDGASNPTVMTNLKLAFRTLFKTPFVTIVAVLSLALGIGANAAIFSLFDQMLLRPLPVARCRGGS